MKPEESAKRATAHATIVSVNLIDAKTVRHYLQVNKIKPLSKKQMAQIIYLIDHREQRAQLKGYTDGVSKEKARIEYDKTEAMKVRQEFKDSLLMTFQRLGDANAQMTTVFSKLMDRL